MTAQPATPLRPCKLCEDSAYIDVLFDGPPSHESGRFVEVEDERGHSINAGEWINRGDGLWALRILRQPSRVPASAPEPVLVPHVVCPDCGGKGTLGRARDGRLIACETCGGHEDAAGSGTVAAPAPGVWLSAQDVATVRAGLAKGHDRHDCEGCDVDEALRLLDKAGRLATREGSSDGGIDGSITGAALRGAKDYRRAGPPTRLLPMLATPIGKGDEGP